MLIPGRRRTGFEIESLMFTMSIEILYLREQYVHYKAVGKLSRSKLANLLGSMTKH